MKAQVFWDVTLFLCVNDPDVSKDRSVVFEDQAESLSWHYDPSETPGTTHSNTQRHMPEVMDISLAQNSVRRSNSRSTSVS